METNKKRILITEGSGFVATHAIKLLLENNYIVRAIVKSEEVFKKSCNLSDLVPVDRMHNFERYELDITQPEDLKYAMKNCHSILHFVGPAFLPICNSIPEGFVESTILLLEEASKMNIKRVVITLSSSNVYINQKDKICCERDWADERCCNNIEKALLDLENSIWETKGAIGNELEVVTMLPGIIAGPSFSQEPLEWETFLLNIITKKFCKVPDASFDFVDVRDVALANMKALEVQEADGSRYILSSKSLSIQDIGIAMTKEVSAYGYCPTTEIVGCFFSKVMSYLDSRYCYLSSYQGKVIKLDHSKAEKELGICFRDVVESIIETVRNLKIKGHLPDKRKKNKLTVL